MNKHLMGLLMVLLCGTVITAPSATAATGPGGAVPDSSGTVYLQEGAYGVAVNILSDEQVEAGVTVCRASVDEFDSEGYAYIMYGQLFVDAYGFDYTVTARACDDSVVYGPVSVHVDVVPVKSVKHVRVRKTRDGYVHRFTNPNTSVMNADDGTALRSGVVCLYGSFDKPAPDGQIRIKAESSKRVLSPRRHLDWLCYTGEYGVLAGNSPYRETKQKSLPGGWKM